MQGEVVTYDLVTIYYILLNQFRYLNRAMFTLLRSTKPLKKNTRAVVDLSTPVKSTAYLQMLLSYFRDKFLCR